MNTLNIAITGYNGYIGSYVMQHLQNLGHRVYGLGRKQAPNTKNFMAFSLSSNSMPDLSNFDVLIHCAYDFSEQSYQELYEKNVNGSIKLFEQAKRQGVKKIIYLSSTSACEHTLSNYGKVKFALEQQSKQFNITIIRPGLVFNKDARGIIGSINRFIRKFGIAPILGKGDQLFFPCHIEDLTNLINKQAIDTNFNSSQPIIAASEQTITFKELIIALAKSQNRRVLFVPLPFSIIYFCLRLAECLHIKLGLRSDSLKYLRYFNPTQDFSATRQSGITFRAMNVATLNEQ